MRVLVFTTVFPSAARPLHGVFVRERLRGLPPEVEAVVVAPQPWFPLVARLKPGWRPAAPREEVQHGVRVHHPRFLSLPGIGKCLDGLFLALGALPTVLRLKRRFRFEVIDAHFAYPDGLAAVLLGRLCRVPVAITLRGTLPILARFRLRRPQIRFALARADRLIAVAGTLAADAATLGIAPERVRVIPNGVDPELFRPLPRGAARRALGLPESGPLVVSVGALSPRKGFHLLVEAAARLADRFPDLRLAIVGGAGGEGDMGAELAAQAARLGVAERVAFPGAVRREDLAAWYSAADLFVLASAHEGCPNVVLEALACGTPVVASAVGDVPRLLADPDTGVVLDRLDPPALAAAIGAALARPWDRERVRLAVAARSWEVVGGEVTEELQAALSPVAPAWRMEEARP